jgi:hypothetical protein
MHEFLNFKNRLERFGLGFIKGKKLGLEWGWLERQPLRSSFTFGMLKKFSFILNLIKKLSLVDFIWNEAFYLKSLIQNINQHFINILELLI